jgi:hypothetical protein
MTTMTVANDGEDELSRYPRKGRKRPTRYENNYSDEVEIEH